jgi:hypothetical protein
MLFGYPQHESILVFITARTSKWVAWCCCVGFGISRYSAPLGVDFNCLCVNTSCQTCLDLGLADFATTRNGEVLMML